MSPSTIRAKGSDAPLIDTGAMRQSITYIIEGGKILINVSEVIRDPDFCTSFRIVRQSVFFTKGNFVVESTEHTEVIN